MKPYYECSEGVLYHGDCLEIMPLLNDKVDLILTDIPYGEVNRNSNGLRNLNKEEADTVNFDIVVLSEKLASLTNGSIYMFCGFQQQSEITKTFINNNLSTRIIVWEKTNPSPMNGEHIWLSGIELCVYGKKPNAAYNGHCKNTVLKYPTLYKNNGHFTPKPVRLFKELIKTSSNIKDIVLDPFAGSGTTAVSAIHTDRKFIMIEKEEKYCDIAIKRIEKALHETSMLRLYRSQKKLFGAFFWLTKYNKKVITNNKQTKGDLFMDLSKIQNEMQKYTAEQIARECIMSRHTVIAIKKGSRNFTIANLDKVVDFLKKRGFENEE